MNFISNIYSCFTFFFLENSKNFIYWFITHLELWVILSKKTYINVVSIYIIGLLCVCQIQYNSRMVIYKCLEKRNWDWIIYFSILAVYISNLNISHIQRTNIVILLIFTGKRCSKSILWNIFWHFSNITRVYFTRWKRLEYK